MIFFVVWFIESALLTAGHQRNVFNFYEILSVEQHFDAGRCVVKRSSQLLILCFCVWRPVDLKTYTLFNMNIIFQD